MFKKFYYGLMAIFLISLSILIFVSCNKINNSSNTIENNENIVSAIQNDDTEKINKGEEVINRTDDSKKVINRDSLLSISDDNNYAIWDYKKGTNDSILEFDLSDELKNITINLGFDNPNGIKAVIVIGEMGYNLITLSDKLLQSAFDEYGELNDGYFLQASKFDFDNDGISEVILSIGNKTTELGISINKYVDNNFVQIGYIEDQAYAYINKDGSIETFNDKGDIINKFKWNGSEFNKMQ